MSYIPFPDLSPFVFPSPVFGFQIPLRWYALAYIAGLLIGWRLVLAAVRSPRLWPGKPPMNAEQVESLLTWVILGVIFGGRLGYVIFYDPLTYLANPLGVLQVWQGGMSFHGGFAGVCAALYLFCRKNGVPLWSAADLLAMATPPGLLLGRLANFVNAELWGRPTDLPWGVAFPGEHAQTCEGIVGICARHPSQLYEAAMEGLILGALLLYLVWRRDWLRWPGRATGLFFAGYGLARFAVEFVRQPDAQFITPGNPLGLAYHIGGWGLTMGQTLSLPMIAIGLWLLLRARPLAANDPA